MPSAPDLAYAMGLPPKDAIAYFKGRGYRISRNAIDAWDAARERAFTVTGIARLDVLQDIKGSLDRRLADGGTYGRFRDEVRDALAAKGWTKVGRGLHADPESAEVAANLPPRRLQTIFRTNTQTALMAGRYKQLSEMTDIAPYWQYVAVMDSKTRPSHAALHGKIFRFDDPFWNTHFPPCGFNCRCGVRALRERDIERRGLDVLTSDGLLEEIEQPVGRSTRPATVFTDPTTGMRMVPDPGFGRRPELAAWSRSGLAETLGQKLEAAEPALAAGIMVGDPRLQTPLAQAYRHWAQEVLASGRSTNAYRVLGAVTPKVVQVLKDMEVDLVSSALAIRDVELLHLAREAKKGRGAAISRADVLELPARLASAPAVFWDLEDPALVYVLRRSGQDADKAVVRVNWTARVRTATGRESLTANAVRTAGKVKVGDLESKRYRLIDGGLAEE
ncbi:phage head morphogenesis protein [Achromobacter anxifer]